MLNTKVLIGHRVVGGSPIFISNTDLSQHLYIVGKTGSGKSTLLHNILAKLIEDGHGIAFIDPHGDEAENILDFIPPKRIDDVVYFDPSDADFPIAMNLLQGNFDKALMAEGIVTAFKSIWKDSWGPLLEYILYASLRVLAENGNTSLLGVNRMLTDSTYRDWAVSHVKDPLVRSVWIDEFAKYNPRAWRESIRSTQNKIGQILMRPMIRNIVGQVRNKVDLGYMMNTNRIFIANLAKGKI